MSLRDSQDVLLTEISGSPSGHLRDSQDVLMFEVTASPASHMLDTQDILMFELPIITGGNFQDVFGNPLAYGYLTLEPTADVVGGGVAQTCGGIKITVLLDANGLVQGAPAVVSGTYTVRAYSAKGQLVWGPSYNLTVGSPLSVAAWVPNVNANS